MSLHANRKISQEQQQLEFLVTSCVNSMCAHCLLAPNQQEAVDEDNKLLFPEMVHILTFLLRNLGVRGIPVPQAIPQEDQLTPTIKVSSDTLGSSIRPPQ